MATDEKTIRALPLYSGTPDALDVFPIVDVSTDTTMRLQFSDLAIVDLVNNQTIGGYKTFSQKTRFSGGLDLYGADIVDEYNGIITIDGDLEVTGGIAGHLIPTAADTYDLGSSTKLWRKGWLSELEAILFVQNSITLLQRLVLP